MENTDINKRQLWSGSYPVPSVCPPPEHPRVMFTKKTLEKIAENLTADENRFAFREYREYLQMRAEGMLPVITDRKNAEIYYSRMAAIEAKAFYYALHPAEKAYGTEAIRGMTDVLRSLEIVPGAFGDTCREYGYAMYMAGCVYDWCYDLLTTDDKNFFVYAVEHRIGPHMEIGVPPALPGAVVGHNVEAQLLRDYLSFSIACYDEFPDVYQFCAGRIFSEFVEPVDFYMKSGCHCQGSSYGPGRYVYLMKAQWLIYRMTDGRCRLFSDDLENAALQFCHNIRPDNQSFRFGDDFQETKTPEKYLRTYDGRNFLFAGTFYRNQILKEAARQELRDFSVFELLNGQLTPVYFLLINDPALPCGCTDDLPCIKYNPSPRGSVIARTDWSSNAAAVYMKIGEAYSVNHEHKDAGCFQLYFHGILASDSGAYDRYGSAHDYAYNKQTISSNCMLVFNPRHSDNGKWVYSGGQKQDEITNRGYHTMDEWRASEGIHRAEILAHAENSERGFSYVYLSGNLTNAYDSDTVSYYRRDMLCVNTFDPLRPLILFVYDDLTSVSKDYEKTFLLHIQQAPRSVSGRTAVVENTKGENHGRLIVHNVLGGDNFRTVGGKGQEFSVNGVNYPIISNCPVNDITEYGWGRLEIKPEKHENNSRLVHVMTTEDSDIELRPENAEGFETEETAGAFSDHYLAIFVKPEAGKNESLSFQLPNRAYDCFICGLKAGLWEIRVDGIRTQTVPVSTQEHLAYITLTAGTKLQLTWLGHSKN